MEFVKKRQASVISRLLTIRWRLHGRARPLAISANHESLRFALMGNMLADPRILVPQGPPRPAA
jgi:hypothetical protein